MTADQALAALATDAPHVTLVGHVPTMGELDALAADARAPELPDAAALARLGAGAHLVGSERTARKVTAENVFGSGVLWSLDGMRMTDEAMARGIAEGALGPGPVQVWPPHAQPMTVRTALVMRNAGLSLVDRREMWVRGAISLGNTESWARAQWNRDHAHEAALIAFCETGETT